MNAVGRLGSYISRGVYTVSGPFHPFGGCVDIIVVEQQDGTFKSSPWYVRFGKFQGVLQTREKVVNICVNGLEANFHMYLDHKGEAYFLREVDEVGESESVLNNSSSGDEEAEGASRPQSSDFGAGNGNVVTRTNSRRARILGLVFGRRSRKESDGGVAESDIKRTESLERAEIAANLLEVKWSTNLDTNKPIIDNTSKFCDPSALEGQEGEDVVRIDGSSSCVEENGLEVPLAATIGEGVRTSNDVEDNSVELQVFPAKQPDEEVEVCDRRGIEGVSSECSVSQDSGTDKVQSFIYCESLESSIVRKDSFSEQTCETMYVASGESGELRIHSEVLRARTEPLSEDTVVEHLLEDYELEMPPVEGLGDYSDKTNSICCGLCAHNVVVDEPLAELESCTRNPVLGSADDELSQDVCTVSSFNKPFPQPEDEENMKVEGSFGEARPTSESPGDCLPTEETNISSSSGLEEEQLLFGDIDEFNTDEIQRTESGSPTNEATEKCLEDIEDVKGELKSPPQKFVNECQSPDFESSTGNFQASSSPITITGARKVVDGEVMRLTESLPNMWTKIDSFEADSVNCLSHSLDSNSKLLDWTLQSKDFPSSIRSDGEKEQQLIPEPSDLNDAMKTGKVKNLSSTALIGDPSSASTSPGRNWRLWPFSFSRSRSRKSTQSDLSDVRSYDAETASEVKIGVVQDEDVVESKVVKKMVRVPCPTSEQLASLNLKEGMNTVTFTFLTPMLGKQQVDAKIYLWKWNTRIVISDVDGTITRSDVLGQFMPLVGVDWSHLGVAHLFSAIKENGYQLLFLSARAISQAYITRQFLFNLKQDGKALPDGPVVISPDGLFPSLYREVIRRAPHEFKIACLEEIRSLFPSDCNPFYAGFGNRDTDEVSYLKVGIPKGKIFIINPKGEVAVNRRVDTKSYKSIHALVNGMFPPTASSEQEDFNSWNFWKLPPLVIDE